MQYSQELTVRRKTEGVNSIVSRVLQYYNKHVTPESQTEFLPCLSCEIIRMGETLRLLRSLLYFTKLFCFDTLFQNKQRILDPLKFMTKYLLTEIKIQKKMCYNIFTKIQN